LLQRGDTVRGDRRVEVRRFGSRGRPHAGGALGSVL
jgi:hypothetical protein